MPMARLRAVGRWVYAPQGCTRSPRHQLHAACRASCHGAAAAMPLPYICLERMHQPHCAKRQACKPAPNASAWCQTACSRDHRRQLATVFHRCGGIKVIGCKGLGNLQLKPGIECASAGRGWEGIQGAWVGKGCGCTGQRAAEGRITWGMHGRPRIAGVASAQGALSSSGHDRGVTEKCGTRARAVRRTASEERVVQQIQAAGDTACAAACAAAPAALQG